jgi:hypothetical protein
MKQTLLQSCVLLVFIALASCAGYAPGRQSYWDSKVRELCETDGGTTIYERVRLHPQEYRFLGGTGRGLSLPSATARPDFPYFIQLVETKLHDANPEVLRLETLVKRRSDDKVLGRAVNYVRRGGDFPTGVLHDSSFSCPQQDSLSERVFEVETNTK